jgi:hypothetical protein
MNKYFDLNRSTSTVRPQPFDLNRSTSTVRPQPFDLSLRLFRIGISSKMLWADVFLRVILPKMAKKPFYTEGSSFSNFLLISSIKI